MPQNGITPQNVDTDYERDRFEHPDDQDTQSLPDVHFDDPVDHLRDGWPSINSDE